MLSVVIPAYRQAKTIRHQLVALQRQLALVDLPYEIIVVVDGDDDGTLAALQSIGSLPHLRVECFTENHGKGFAVRYGMTQARGDLIALLDAGGDLDARYLPYMVETMQVSEADIVVGSKRHPLSRVLYPPVRRMYSLLYQILNRLLFNLNVTDTQVGMKVIRAKVVKQVLPRLLVKKFAFDLEFLVVADHVGFHRIVEAPVHITHAFHSTVRLPDALQVIWDTAAIFYRLRIRHWYDQTHPFVAQPQTILGKSAVPQSVIAYSVHPISSPQQHHTFHRTENPMPAEKK